MSDVTALDPARIHPVFAGSNALSPFHDCYANQKTVLRIAAGRFFAHHNGEDVAAAYWALRRDAALYDVPERPVEISGSDAIAFLERVFARKIGSMAVGRGMYMLALAHDGGLFMDGILFRLAQDRFWFVHPDGDLDTWFLAHSNGYDVHFTDPQSRVLQLQGPKSLAIMNAASEGAITQSLCYFDACPAIIAGQQVYVSRTGWSGELGYEIYTNGSDTDCPRLWNRLISCGAPHNMVFASMQSINISRIEAGILDSGSDFDTSMKPAEAGLSRFVDMQNLGFIGRDALMDDTSNLRLHGFICKGFVPVAGSEIYADGKAAGFVTTGTHSPHFKAGIGYIRFAHADDWVGRQLHAKAADGQMHVIDVVALPFYDREKRLPRFIPQAG